MVSRTPPAFMNEKSAPVDSRMMRSISRRTSCLLKPRLATASGRSTRVLTSSSQCFTSEVKHWEDEVSTRVDRPLAVASRGFSKQEVRRLIERIMRESTGADFSFMNAGGVRDTIPAGQLKERNIWNIMPFDNRIVFGKFKGRDLPATMRLSNGMMFQIFRSIIA